MTNVLKAIAQAALLAAGLFTFVIAQAPAQVLEDAALDALLEKAESPADHLKLADHYTAQAKQLRASADRHRSIGAKYQKKGLPPKSAEMWRNMNRHCVDLARSFASAAKQSEELAAMHRAMAEQGR